MAVRVEYVSDGDDAAVPGQVHMSEPRAAGRTSAHAGSDRRDHHAQHAAPPSPRFAAQSRVGAADFGRTGLLGDVGRTASFTRVSADDAAAVPGVSARDNAGGGASADVNGDALHRGVLPPARHITYGQTEVSLNAGRMAKQFFYHLCWPVSLLFLPLLEAHPQVLLWRQAFVPFHRGKLDRQPWMFVAGQAAQMIVPPMLLVCHLLGGHVGVTMDMVLALSSFGLRAAVISVKYAMMSDAMWAFYSAETTSDEQAQAIMAREQLITGWLEWRPHGVQIEMDTVAAAEQVDLAKQFFYVDNMPQFALFSSTLVDSALECQHVAKRNYELDSDAGVASLGFIASVAVYNAMEKSNSRVRSYMHLSYAVGAITAAIPLVTRSIMSGDPLPEDKGFETVAVAVMSVYLTFQMVTILQLFLLSGVMDYQRRAECLNIVGRFVSSLRQFEVIDPETTQVKVQPPLIDLRRPTNVLGWALLRNLMVGLGFKYHVRVQSYASVGLFGSAVLLGILVSDVWAATETGSDVAFGETIGFRDGPSAAIFLVYSLVTIITWTSAVLAMVGHGAVANKAYMEHKALLVRQQANVRMLLRVAGLEDPNDAADIAHHTPAATMAGGAAMRTSRSTKGGNGATGSGGASLKRRGSEFNDADASVLHLSPERIVALKRAVPDLKLSNALLDSAMRSIKAEDKLHPVRVFGVRADLVLLRSIGTVIASVLVAVVNRLAGGGLLG